MDVVMHSDDDDTMHMDASVDAMTRSLVASVKTQQVTRMWALMRRYSAGAVGERLECIPVDCPTYEETAARLSDECNSTTHMATFGGIDNVEMLTDMYNGLGDDHVNEEAMNALKRKRDAARARLATYRATVAEWAQNVLVPWQRTYEECLRDGRPVPDRPVCPVPPHDPDQLAHATRVAIEHYVGLAASTYAMCLVDMVANYVPPEELNMITTHDPEYFEDSTKVEHDKHSGRRTAVTSPLAWHVRVVHALADELERDAHAVNTDPALHDEIQRRITERETELLLEKRDRLTRERLVAPRVQHCTIESDAGRQALGALAIMHAFRGHPLGSLDYWFVSAASIANSTSFVLVFNERAVADLTPFTACILRLCETYMGFWETWRPLWRQLKPRGLRLHAQYPDWVRDRSERIAVYRNIFVPYLQQHVDEVPYYAWARVQGIDLDVATDAALCAFDFMNHQEGRMALGVKTRDETTGAAHAMKKWARLALAEHVEAWQRDMAYERDVLRAVVPTRPMPTIVSVYNPAWARVQTLSMRGALHCPSHE